MVLDRQFCVCIAMAQGYLLGCGKLYNPVMVFGMSQYSFFI